jgi:serine protease Do
MPPRNKTTLMRAFENFAAAAVSQLKPTRRNQSELTFAATVLETAFFRTALGLASVFLLAQAGFSQTPALTPADELRSRLNPAVDDTHIQAELTRIGSILAERGQLLPKDELLKSRPETKLTLPDPTTQPCDETELATKCRESVVVVARMTRIGGANTLVAVPATGFFISTNGVFVTSSHLIHQPDYEGMIVLTGAGRILPVRAVLADDEENDVAILKADGASVAALSLATSVAVGSRVAVMSHPVGRFLTFTQGSVTRRSLQHRDAHSQELLEITAEFGPGSSGAPVVNSGGNVVGWVDTLRVWPGDANRDPNRNPTLTFRECGVSSDILRLVKQHEVGAN